MESLIANLPTEWAVFLAVLFVGAGLAQGIASEYTRRKGYIQDLQIIELLNNGSDESKEVAKAYEKKVLGRIEDYCYGTSSFKIAIKAIIKGTPVLWLVFIIWFFMELYSLYQGTFTFGGAIIDLIGCSVAELITEGMFSIIRPFLSLENNRWHFNPDKPNRN